jgi:hypothetical protein
MKTDRGRVSNTPSSLNINGLQDAVVGQEEERPKIQKIFL